MLFAGDHEARDREAKDHEVRLIWDTECLPSQRETIFYDL